jgi:hypothetical protein
VKLFIYDTYDEDNKEQAEGRFDDSSDIVALPAASKEELLAGLDRLVKANAVFDRALFQTHGGPGHINFGKNHIWDIILRDEFKNRQYHSLFPVYTRMYFDGCEVGQGSNGTTFLEMAGAIFLRLAGGETFAFTSPGYGFDSWVPFIGGHTVHFSGSLIKFRFGPGGVRLPDPTPSPAEIRFRETHGRF